MDESSRELTAVLTFMVSGPDDGDVPSFDGLGGWWVWYLDAARPFESPIARALVGGRVADRVGYAFTAGYVSAIRWLVPAMGRDELTALCVTEEGSAHPRAVQATLTEDKLRGGGKHFRLIGEKSFVTNADLATRLVVAASAGTTPDGKNDIRMVLVERDAGGVNLVPREPLPFIPEVAHGRVRFEDVDIPGEALLPGDGYTGYVKPFRTIEDIHVFGGLLGYLVRIAMRYRWPEAAVEELLSLVASVWSLAGADEGAPSVHVALGGLHGRMSSFLEEYSGYWEQTDDDTRRRWERDRPLMNIAGEARTRRLKKAWRRIGEGRIEG
jgi:hypothetical protein